MTQPSAYYIRQRAVRDLNTMSEREREREQSLYVGTRKHTTVRRFMFTIRQRPCGRQRDRRWATRGERASTSAPLVSKMSTKFHFILFYFFFFTQVRLHQKHSGNASFLSGYVLSSHHAVVYINTLRFTVVLTIFSIVRPQVSA